MQITRGSFRSRLVLWSLGLASVAAGLAAWCAATPAADVAPRASSPVVAENGPSGLAAPVTRHALAAPIWTAITVRDRTTGQPVGEAQVEIAPAVEAADAVPLTRLRTNVDGRVSVEPAERSVVVAVRKIGYTPHLAEHELVADRVLEIEIEPTCTLEVAFVGHDGAAVADLPVRLLPEPITPPGWREDWFHSSSGAAFGYDDSQRLAQLLALAGGSRQAARSGAAAPTVIDLTCPTRSAALALAVPIELPGMRTFDPSFRLVVARMNQVTGADGVVRFAGIPVGAGYRFGICAPVHVDMQPPHENVAVTAAGPGVRVGSGPVPLLSGVMVPKAGETLRFAVRVHRGASVRGRLHDQLSVKSAWVKLFHREEITANGAAVESHSEEAMVAVAADGSFCFENVAAGDKIVRASWQASPGDIYFAAASTHVTDGEARDLGVLQPLTGSSAEGTLRLVDGGGRELDPVATFGRVVDALLIVETVADSRIVDQSLSDIIRLPVGSRFRLHGLPPGKAWIRATTAGDWTDPHESGFSVSDQAVVERAIPLTAPLELVIVVAALHSCALEMVVPADLVGERVELWVSPRAVEGAGADSAPPAAPQSRRVRVRAATDTVTLNVAPGEYDVFAYSQTAAVSAGACGSATVAVAGSGQTSSARIVLRPAAMVRGIVVDPQQRPVAGLLMQWTLPPFGASSPPAWVFRARTAEDGSFALLGLPPQQRLLGMRGGTDLTVGPAGSASAVVLSVESRAVRR